MRRNPPFLPTAALVCGALLAATAVHAHDVWFATDSEGWVLRFGHGDEPYEYPAHKVRVLDARDAAGRGFAPAARRDGALTRVAADPRVAVLSVEFDNGFFSRTPDGSRPGAMNEVPGATSGSHALKFGKRIEQWGETARTPVGHALELVPLGAEAPRAGATLAVRVLRAGAPLPGAVVRSGEQESRTDPDGVARLPVVAGPNLLLVERREPASGQPRYDTLSLAASLGFTVR